MKRLLYILSVIIVSLLIVMCMLFSVLMNSEVQTSIVRVVTEELSRGLGVGMHVGQVSYRFPARLQLNDIYIADPQGDTLLYSELAYIHLKPLALRHKQVAFSTVQLHNTYANLYTLENGEPNYAFLVKAFASTDTTQKEIPDWILNARDVRVEQFRVRYEDWHGELALLEVALNTLSKEAIDVQVKHLMGSVQHADQTTVVEDVHIDWLWNDSVMTFPVFYAKLPHSVLDISTLQYAMPKDEAQGKDMSRGLVSMHIHEAELSPQDIGALVPAIGKLAHPLTVQGDLEGRIDSLDLTGFSVAYNHQSILKGHVLVQGLPQTDSTTIYAECEDLYLNARLLQDFLSDLHKKPVHIPQPIHRLGDMHYRGLLSGHLHSLQLKGAFRTALGTITTDGRLQTDSAFSDLAFNGRISTKRFRIGRLLSNNDLKTITFDIRANGHYLTSGSIDTKIDATIKEICYRDYCYQDIRLSGTIKDHTYNGTFAINDENVQFALNGLVEYDGNNTEIDIDMALRRLHTQPLHLSEKYSDADLRFTTSIHTIGWQIDSLMGYLRIDSLYFRNGSDSIEMRELEIVLENEQPKKILKLTSDYAAMCIKGQYDYATLLTTFQKAALMYVPDIFTEQQKRTIRARASANVVDFYLYGRQIRKLQRALGTPFFISDYPVVKGYLNEPNKIFGLQGYIPYIRLRQGDIRDITTSIHNTEDQAMAILTAGWYDSQYTLKTTLQDNTARIDLTAAGSDKVVTSHFQADAFFSQYADKPAVDVHILPGVMEIADSTIHIAQSDVRYTAADKKLYVDHFQIGTSSHFIKADGVASPLLSDSLHIQLSHIDAGAIMPFVVAEETIGVGGDLSGWADVYSVFSSPMFNADVTLDSALLNEACIGNATAKLYLDKETNHLIIDGDVTDNGHLVAHVDGLVEPEKNRWGLEIYPDSFSLAFINHWTHGIINDISGRAWGQVNVSGEGKKTWVITKAWVENGALTIPYTGCRYHFTDSAFMDSTAIHFANMQMYDTEGNELYLDGHLYHTYFKNFSFQIDAYPHHCLAIDLPDKAGEFIQGKVYADGEVHIAGDDTDVLLSAKATAVGKSRFRMSVDGASTAASTDFIDFVDHNKVDINEDEDDFKKQEEDQSFLNRKYVIHGPSTRFRMAMDIDITPELLFQLMLNDRTGDMLQGRGDGSLRMTYDDSSGDVRLMGTYTLLSGSLGFTIGNLVRRDFTLAEGGRVIWNGKAESPELDVTAKYRVTASLRDLFGDEVNALTTSRTSVPVNCCVTLTGSIEDPTIRFALELPNSEDVIQTQVRSIINTDEMLMRQVVYLLVFGKFFTPDYLKNSNYSGLNETYSLLSSTITGQINSWLGKLTNVFTMGFNFRSEGVGAESSQEYEAQFQLQPIDRLLINGNVGYRYNDITNRPVFGDLDVEYIITPDGKLRLKAYTHTVDKYSLRQANTQQGVGFVFKHDFNWKKDKE